MQELRRLKCLPMLRSAVFVLAFSCVILPIYAEETDSAEYLSQNASASGDTTSDLIIAFIAFESEEFALAAKHFLNAAQVQPDASIAEFAMRSALLADDKDSAIAAGKLWSRVDEANPVSIEFRIRAYSRMAAVDAAVDELERLRQLSTGDGYHGFLPLLPLLFRDPSNLISIKLMQGLVERHKHDVYAHFAMADLAMRFRLHELALSSSLWALQIDPDFGPAAMQYASSLQFLNKTDQALDHLFEFISSHPDDEQVRSYYARLLNGQGQSVEAYAQYLILSERDRSNEDYIYALAKMAYQFEDYDAAWRYYLELVIIGERGEEAKFMLGKIDELTGNLEKAISWYSSVGPSQFFFDGHVRAVQLLAQTGQHDVALAAMQKLYDANPVGRFTDLILLEGSILVAANREHDAYKLYTDHFDGPPRRHAELLYARALLARDMGNDIAYRRDLKEVLVIDEDHHAGLVDLALVFINDTLFEQATLYLQRALDLYPDDARTLANYGWLQMRMGEYSQALSYLEKAAALADDPIIFAYLGETHWEMGSLEQARLIWHRGLAKSPANERLIGLIRTH